MAMLRPESEMKDSGTRYLTKVPSDWNISKLKRHLRREEPKNPGEVPVLSLYRELGIVLKDSRDDNHNVTSENTSNYKYVQVGDFVVNKMKAWQGSVAVSDYEGIVSPAYYVYHFTDDVFVRRYFHYLLRSAYKEEFMRLSGGIRTGQWDLPSNALDNIMILIPSLREQSVIASYLDDRCSKLDEIIAEAEKSIEEYKELKQAVITEAVTKGFGSDFIFNERVKLSCPVGWGVCRIKDVAFVQRGGSPRPIEQFLTNANDGLNWIKIGDTTKGYKYIDNVGQKIIKEGLSKTRFVKSGTLLLTNSMSFGEPYILRVDGCIHDGWVALTCNEQVDKEFLYYFLCSDFCKTQFRLSVAGSIVQNLNVDKIGSTYVLMPSIDEQQDIVKYLDRKTEDMNALISEKQSLIEDLKAYKKSLIFEVVTGKRRVV